MNILYLGVRFFGYEKQVSEELKKFAYSVRFIPERPRGILGVITDYISKKSKSEALIKMLYMKYIKIMIRNNKYDLILVLRGSWFTKEFVLFLKKHLTPRGKCIYYTWDSFVNAGNAVNTYCYYDIAYTFDRSDYENHKQHGLRFKPLFYNGDFYKPRKENEKSRQIKIAFIASYRVERYAYARQLMARMPDTYVYFTVSIAGYIKNMLTSRAFRKIDKSILHFKKLNASQLNSIYGNSKAVVDITYGFQNGLSMRTLEVLPTQTKLITNNVSIVEYNIYDENNYYILRENENEIPSIAWLETPYTSIETSIIKTYSLSSWVLELLRDADLA